MNVVIYSHREEPQQKPRRITMKIKTNSGKTYRGKDSFAIYDEIANAVQADLSKASYIMWERNITEVKHILKYVTTAISFMDELQNGEFIIVEE